MLSEQINQTKSGVSLSCNAPTVGFSFLLIAMDNEIEFFYSVVQMKMIVNISIFNSFSQWYTAINYDYCNCYVFWSYSLARFCFTISLSPIFDNNSLRDHIIMLTDDQRWILLRSHHDLLKVFPEYISKRVNW